MPQVCGNFLVPWILCNNFWTLVLYIFVLPYLFTSEHLELSFFVTNLSGHALEWATEMWGKKKNSPCFDTVAQFAAALRNTFSSPASPPCFCSPSPMLPAGDRSSLPAVQFHVRLPHSTGPARVHSPHFTVQELATVSIRWLSIASCPSSRQMSFTVSRACPTANCHVSDWRTCAANSRVLDRRTCVAEYHVTGR